MLERHKNAVVSLKIYGCWFGVQVSTTLCDIRYIIHTYISFKSRLSKNHVKIMHKEHLFLVFIQLHVFNRKNPFISGLFSLLHGGGIFDEFDYCLKFEAFLFIVVFFWYFRPLGFFCPSVSAGVQRGGGCSWLLFCVDLQQLFNIN